MRKFVEKVDIHTSSLQQIEISTHHIRHSFLFFLLQTMKNKLFIFFLFFSLISSLTKEEENDRLCSTIPAIFSILFILFVLFSIFLFLQLHTQAFFILFLQNFSELLFNFNKILFFQSTSEKTSKCLFQGWFNGFTTISTVLFSGLISYYMSSLITKRNYSLSNSNLIVISICIYILSSLLAAIPFITNQFGEIGIGCGILEDGSKNTSKTVGIAMRYSLYYGIIWFVCLYCIWAYISIYKFITNIKKQLQANRTPLNNPNNNYNNNNNREKKEIFDIEKTIYRLRYYPGNNNNKKKKELKLLLLSLFSYLSLLTFSLFFFTSLLI